VRDGALRVGLIEDKINYGDVMFLWFVVPIYQAAWYHTFSHQYKNLYFHSQNLTY